MTDCANSLYLPFVLPYVCLPTRCHAQTSKSLSFVLSLLVLSKCSVRPCTNHPLSYSSLSAPTCKHKAHVNKHLCFSLVNLSFVRLICRAPANKPELGRGFISYTSPPKKYSMKKWRGGASHFTVEKPNKHDLSQAIKFIIINSDRSRQWFASSPDTM